MILASRFLCKVQSVCPMKKLVHHAGTVPKQHFASGFFHYVFTQVFVRGKDDGFVFRDGFDNFDGIRRSHHDVGQGFHFGRTIYVSNDNVVRMCFCKFLELFRRTGFGEGTTRFQIGKDYFFGRVQYFGRFGHEMYTRKKG